MVLIAADEAARRARAAIAYSGLEHDEVCRRTGITDGTLRNILSKTRPSGGTQPRLHKIAVACDVPPTFMDVGFAPLEKPVDDLTARLLELERAVNERLDRVEAEFRAAAATRFADEAREEGRPQPGHPASGTADPDDEDAAGGDR